MGGVTSYFSGSPTSNEPDPVTGLTPREKLLVENSWNLVKKDLVGNGMRLMLVFLGQFPEYQNVFSFKDVPFEELPTNTRLKGHATSVIYALSAIIDNLNNNEILLDLLVKNGLSHGNRNIPKKAYWDLKISALEFLRTVLGSKFTKETEEAWDKTITVAFNVITNALKEE